MVSQREVNRLLSDPCAEVAWGTGHRLTGVNLKVTAVGWLMVVKVRGRSEQGLVAFIEMPTLLECWGYLAEHCYRTNAPLKFHPDKWAQ